MRKTDRTIFDGKRASQITARLRENGADVTELLYAVDGALRDDWIMGRAPKTNGQTYNGIETIFRERAQVERLVALVPAKRPEHPFLTQQKGVT